jgi:hypothetical protein
MQSAPLLGTLATGALLLTASIAEAGEIVLVPATRLPPVCMVKTGGDTEYDGHGPDVRVDAWLGTWAGGKLRVQVQADMLETSGNRTRGVGTAIFDLAQAPDWLHFNKAWRLVDGVWDWVWFPNDIVSKSYRDQNVTPDSFSVSSWWWAYLLAVGDTRGTDFGTGPTCNGKSQVQIQTHDTWWLAE